jgi:hypothetical protein
MDQADRRDLFGEAVLDRRVTLMFGQWRAGGEAEWALATLATQQCKCGTVLHSPRDSSGSPCFDTNWLTS